MPELHLTVPSPCNPGTVTSPARQTYLVYYLNQFRFSTTDFEFGRKFGAGPHSSHRNSSPVPKPFWPHVEVTLCKPGRTWRTQEGLFTGPEDAIHLETPPRPHNPLPTVHCLRLLPLISHIPLPHYFGVFGVTCENSDKNGYFQRINLRKIENLRLVKNDFVRYCKYAYWGSLTESLTQNTSSVMRPTKSTLKISSRSIQNCGLQLGTNIADLSSVSK